MDYSPYRKKSSMNGPSFSFKKFLPVLILVGCLLLGFGLFWGMKSLFFSDTGSSTISTFQAYESVAEIQLEESDVWTSLEDGGVVMQGEKIRTVIGEGGQLYLKNGSTLAFGENSTLFLEEIREISDGLIFGDIRTQAGSFLYSGKSGIDQEEKLKIWISSDVYVEGNSGTFFIEDGVVHYLSGENIDLVKIDESGKILKQQNIGIGQSLRATTFLTEATPSTVRGESIVIQAIGDLGNVDASLSTSADLASPTIISPKSGYIVEESSQKIIGTAPLGAEQILILFENGDNTSSLSFAPTLSEDGDEKIWDYTVQESFDTLTKGINNYTIYAVDLVGNKSLATKIILKYQTGEKNDDTTDSDSEITGDGTLNITSPNGGSDGKVDKNVITISGSAPDNAVFIRVTNKTTGTPSYILQKFAKGDATWRYFTSPMPANTYSYLVEALSSSKSVIATETISITVPEGVSPTPSNTPNATTTSNSTISSTPSPSTPNVATPKPIVSTSTPTQTPAIQSATLEASR